MNVNQVKYFVSAYELSSFSRAAKTHSVTVQAVSKAIGDLENESHARLFERSSRAITPTPEGRALYQKALPVLEAFSDLERFPNCAASEAEPSALRIAFCTPPFDGCDALTGFLRKMIREKMGIDAQFCVADPAHALAGVAAGEVDALLTVGAVNDDAYECTCLGTFSTGIAVTKDHPLASKQSVTLADLAPYPAGMSSRYDAFCESIFLMYKNRGLVGNYEKVTSAAQAIEMMHERHGYFFSAILAGVTMRGMGTVVVPIDPKEALRAPSCLVIPKGLAAPQLAMLKRLFLSLPSLLMGQGQSGQKSPACKA